MTPFHALLLALALSHGADVATTLTCPQPCQEQNALVADPFRHRALFLTEVAATTAGEVYVLNKLHRKHPRVAMTILIASLSLEGLAVGNNLYQRRK